MNFYSLFAVLRRGLRASAFTVAAAAALGGAAPVAHAGTVSYSGSIDSGPLSGSVFGGALSFADPVAGFDGSVLLSGLSLNFMGQGYSLADADAGTAPAAWFVGGRFVGVDFIDIDTASLARPGVQFTAGFFDFSEALFSYDRGAGTAGFGSYALLPSSVPEPSPWALLLGGLGLLALAQPRAKARPH